jgi:putative ABC transport system permease protein
MAVEATHVANVYPDYGLPPEELGQFIRYRDGALVGRQTLRRHGWRIGHRIRLASALWGADLELEIVGALPGQPGLWLQEAHLEEALRERGGDGLPWNSIVWLRLDDLERRATVGEEPAATGSGARPVQGVEDAIEALGREVGVPLVLQSERSFYSRLLADLRGLATMLELVGALVAGCVTVVAASSISLGVRDRWRELATLRALGWSRSRIVAIVLGESSTIGVLGGIGGLLAARALVELARAIGGSDVAIGMLAAAQLDASTAAGVLACTAVVGSLVGILPAYGAVRRPSQALLREVPA